MTKRNPTAVEKKFEQLSPLSDDVQMALEIFKAMVPAQHPLDASRMFIEAQGELVQLTCDYIEQCGRVVEAAMHRMRLDRVQ